MTDFIEVDVKELSLEPVSLWSDTWMLMTAGDMNDCNMMTVGWGSIGCMWSKPFVQVVVRPQRYTREYMDDFDTFTLCAFPEDYRNDLAKLGAISGRERDKLAETSLTLRESAKVAAPSYNEANLILECRKVYRQMMEPAGFIDESIDSNYPANDYHVIYFGEILAAFATP